MRMLGHVMEFRSSVACQCVQSYTMFIRECSSPSWYKLLDTFIFYTQFKIILQRKNANFKAAAPFVLQKQNHHQYILPFKMVASKLVSCIVLLLGPSLCCETEFHGFGVHLGSIQHFNSTSKQLIEQVIDKVYFDLKIRHLRTSYEAYFSPSPGKYTLACDPSHHCTWSWETILEILSNQTKYRDVTFIASVWSPPSHLMNPETFRLIPEKELDYYFYLKNITNLIKDTYGISIQRISPVNEPENLWATWSHCNMDPSQLCGMVTNFNDPLISLCTENSYFWMTEIYLKYKNHRMGIDCLDACQTLATHSYALSTNSSSSTYGMAYYDLDPYPNPFTGHHHHPPHPIWMTEVSSTYPDAVDTQMSEGLDFATNLINFVGITCVERYYYWSAFTTIPSGESLIWLDSEGSQLLFPKKYHIYQHFTNASSRIGPEAKVKTCKETKYVGSPGSCLTFTNRLDNVTVFMNRGDIVLKLGANPRCPCGLCCTTDESDLVCNSTNRKELPPRSICTCVGSCGKSKPRRRKPSAPAKENTTGKSYREVSYGFVMLDTLLQYFL